MHESVAQNTLLDPRDFAFESPPIKTRKRTAHDGESSDELLERRRLVKNERTRARRQRLRDEAAQSSTQPQKKESISKNSSTALHVQGPPSPTPPMEHTREAVGSNFKFTDSEHTYAIKYVQVLLARDHEISSFAIGAALHDKVGDSYFLSTLVIYLSVRCLIIRLAHGELI